MTILEAIKKAEERQKTLGENTAKIYIRRKDWVNLLDPIDFSLVYGEYNITPFKKIVGGCALNKENLLNNNWELFTRYFAPETENKDNKESVPESTSIPRKIFINSIEQIAKAKFCLNSLNEHVKDIKTVFETTYGISFDCFKRNTNILIDKENRILYLFAIIASSYSKEINNCLSKIEAELDNLNGGKKTE